MISIFLRSDIVNRLKVVYKMRNIIKTDFYIDIPNTVISPLKKPQRFINTYKSGK